MSSSGHDDEPSPERLAKNPVGVGVGVGVGGTTNTRRVKKKRVRNFTEDDRAAHRIFEKSRREAFKEALTNLASLLPALADTEPQRLSKHVVVDESITFIRAQHEQIRTVAEHLETVKIERDELLAELNHWRSGAGIERRQTNTINQPAIHRRDTSATSEAIILGAVPAALQPTDSPMRIIGEAAPPFTNTLHEPNPTPLPTDSNASMHWESFEPQIHPFTSHVQRENGPTSMGNADPTQLSTYQTPQSPIISQFNVDRGQHGAVFLPFESPQPFNAGGFQADTFMPNAVPLPDYIPP
ncbi:hypothetical protein E0Z10_g9346 [Xylaria hypoxylon]|uniref:BHLH domain-containing protein n=1 Tax=Xylaria hypoxylon TaxID=37992 RepID=A0A4Z0YP93_9PEZI|nr:hypothetical protein E0Z10_g9346 [Xylaria hypoxylon]